MFDIVELEKRRGSGSGCDRGESEGDIVEPEEAREDVSLHGLGCEAGG